MLQVNVPRLNKRILFVEPLFHYNLNIFERVTHFLLKIKSITHPRGIERFISSTLNEFLSLKQCVEVRVV